MLGCSRALVNDLALAAERAAEIKAGKRKVEDVPPRLRPYLNLGFPMPRQIGIKLKRINAAELQAYVEREQRR